MATFRNFPGKSQEWLEAQLAIVLDDIAAGKTVVSSAAGDSSLTEKTEGSLIRRKEMLLSDLSVLDSTTYPRTQVIAHKRARVRYT